MALVESRWRDEEMRRSFWDDDRWMRDWDDWPIDWPQPRELVRRFRSAFDRRRSFLDWPSDWPTMDAVVPRFSSHLDRMDRNWRSDPFWRDLYPRWAEPIFKEGIDIKTKITNDSHRFAVDVKTVDDTLLIEGRHEDVRDRDNFTKMYFVRKYQLPSDVDPADVCSSIDSTGRLTVEATKRQRLASGRERVIPIEGPSRRGDNRGQQRSDSNSSLRERERRSPQTTHSSHTYYHESSRTGGGQGANQSQERTQYRGEERSGFDTREKREREYRSETRNEYRSESRDSHRDDYRQDGSLDRHRYRVDSPSTSTQQNGGGGFDTREKREREYRSETRNEYRSESRDSHRDDYRQDGSLDRHRYRVDSPSTSTQQNGGGEAAKSESRSSVRSVQILRKTFQ
uniref:SHSP domain-containing protein n=1 Tax=Ascaris lumbricoides TaxID=6252 RepID=A0A9J2Q7D2_ASCLU